MLTISRWRRDLRIQIGQVLSSLGDDPAEVARRLEAAGVRGTPRDPRNCAIAVYLGAVVGADPRVRFLRVMPERVFVVASSWWRPPVIVPLPEALREFIPGFDLHAYPALVRLPQPERDAAEHFGSSLSD